MLHHLSTTAILPAAPAGGQRMHPSSVPTYNPASPWQSFADHSHDPLARLDAEGRYEYVNAAFLREAKTTAEALLNQDFREVPFPFDDRSHPAHALVPELFEQRRKFVTYPKKRLKGGRRRYFRVRFIPEQDAAATTTVGMLISAHEVTHFRQAEVEALRKSQQLERLNDRLNTFVHAVAHDLRSPVNNLQSLMELIDLSESEAEQEMMLGKVRELTSRLDNTLSDLTELIKVQRGTEQAAETVDLRVALSDVEKELEAKIRETGAEITADFEQVSTISYIRPYICSILRNLLSNSLKYHQPGRPPRIEISARPDRKNICLCVQDNGIGIDLKKHGSDVFKAFRRLTNRASGSGVGLNIIQSMVEEYGGYINVESEVGEGTCFEVYLKPVDRPARPPQ